jgi:hypothetical protein
VKELLHLGLAIGGWSLVALCIGSLWIPAALGWREKLAVLSPLMRDLWWTYSIYVWASHLFFAVLALGFGDWLMGGSAAAVAMCSFMLIWWAARLCLQFFGFDLGEIEDSVANRWAKHALTLLFAGLVLLYAGLLSWNLGLAGNLR